MVYEGDGLKTIHNHSFMQDEKFKDAYWYVSRLLGKDYGWYWRNYIGIRLACMAMRRSLNFVECGVGQGWMSLSIIRYFRRNYGVTPFMTLFDTFTGIDAEIVDPKEVAYWGVSVEERKAQYHTYEGTTFSMVKSYFDTVSEASDRIRFVQGSIPGSMTDDVIASIASRGGISFLHIDMNNSVPEVAALERLYPLLTIGGVVLLDDYAYTGYEYQYQQMNKLCDSLGIESPIALPTGQGLLIRTS
jgi:Methyltransferase domain